MVGYSIALEAQAKRSISSHCAWFHVLIPLICSLSLISETGNCDRGAGYNVS